MEGPTFAELGLKRELELPISPNQGSMVRNVEMTETKKLEQRLNETFGLAPRQGVLESREESEFDDRVRVSPGSASLAGLSRLPGAKEVGREMEGQGTPPQQGRAHRLASWRS